jgi:hypothetical protein
LIRRTWNSKYTCKKVVWQCRNYVRKGKDACSGTRIDNATVSRLTIKEETIVKEAMKDGKKHYLYTSKRQSCGARSGEFTTSKKEDGSLLQGVDRPRGTVIKLSGTG